MRIQSNNRYVLTDMTTGEVIKLHEGDKIVPQTQIFGLKKRLERSEAHIPFESKDFVKVDRQYLMSEKNPSERLISEVIFGLVGYNGTLTRDIKKISRLSGASRQTVSKYLKILEQKNVIKCVGDIIYVNPWIGLRGRYVTREVLEIFIGGDESERGADDGDCFGDDDGA